jgi:replicative DNA helicase
MSKMELYSERAERTVIGRILIDNTLLDEMSVYCDIKDFYTASIRDTLTSMTEIEDRDGSVSFVTLCESQANDPNYIRFLTDCQRSALDPFKQSALIVREKADMRRLVEAANKVLETCYNPDMAFRAKLEKSQDLMLNAVEQKTDSVKDGRDQMRIFVDDMEEKSQHKGFIGLDTPWTNLNDDIITTKKGEVVTVAGRPGQGKTNFALNWFMHQVRSGNSALYFSMEMTTDELMCRIASDWTNTYYSKFHNARFECDEWSKITGMSSVYKDLKTYIDDSSSQTISTLRAKCRRIKKLHDLHFIVVDHIGLMDHGCDNETIGLSKISRELKRLAKDLDIVVVMLSQLNRDCEKRPNKRPVMSDLRQSGSIEQDSDTILFLYRDEYYNNDSPNKGIAEIIRAKARKGVTGTTLLATQFEMCRFKDTDHEFVEQKVNDYSKGMDY